VAVVAKNSPENTMRFEFEIHLKPIQQIGKKTAPKKEPSLRFCLVLAHQIQELFDQGKVKSLSEAAVLLNMCNARISQVLNLVSLAPEIQKEILIPNIEATEKITEFHIRCIAMEPKWGKQIETWTKIKKGVLVFLD
jgi:hypothetical protein